jgi:hypothetical protein
MRIVGQALAILLLLAAFAGAAEAPYRLAPYKDELFAYPKILKSEYDGAFLTIEYNRQRDLYDRDQGKRVDPKYVSLATKDVESDLVLDAGSMTVKHYAVGKKDGDAKAIVAFIHGSGADRHAGANDWIHGGNFNRIKNLMMLNDGLYLSPDFANFGVEGTDQVKALLIHYIVLSPGAPVFLACGSFGGKICWRLVKDPGFAPLISGLILLDSDMDPAFLAAAKTADPDKRLPVHVSNSMGDWIIGWRDQLKFFKNVKAAVPDYPIRFALFSAGTHGISLRMTDWRLVINWMLSVHDGLPE